jgi:hypothetical protein
MASSVKIKNETKTKLDKLQATILLKFGKKLSQQDIIELLVNLGEKNPSNLFEIKTLTKEKVKEILALSEPWSIETNPDMLDDLLVEE